jgi:hypothetical protein
MNNEEQQPVLIKPEQLYKVATDVAGLCGQIVKNTAISIKGKKYVKVEGWEAIAAAHGYVAGARDVERIDTGWRCMGELRRISDGTMIAQSEGFVGDDEPVWVGGDANGKHYQERNEYAIRAMCQTRAISRVCRSAFAHVVVLIDKDLSTTPAEEISRDQAPWEDQAIQDRQNAREKLAKNWTKGSDKGNREAEEKLAEANKALLEASQGQRRSSPPEKPVQANVERSQTKSWQDVICTYGKPGGPMRGELLGTLNLEQLQFLYTMFGKPDLSQINPKDRLLAVAIRDWNDSLDKDEVPF